LYLLADMLVFVSVTDKCVVCIVNVVSFSRCFLCTPHGDLSIVILSQC